MLRHQAGPPTVGCIKPVPIRRLREVAMKTRGEPRYPVHCSAVFAGENLLGEGMVLNLSAIGCSVKSTWPVHKKAHLELYLTLPTGEVPTKVDLATVTWTQRHRFGLEFPVLPREHRSACRGSLALWQQRSKPDLAGIRSNLSNRLGLLGSAHAAPLATAS